MSVFDGGTERVSVRRRSTEDEEDFYPGNPAAFVEELIDDPDVIAVLTRRVHYVIGDVVDSLSFGDFWGDEEDE